MSKKYLNDIKNDKFEYPIIVLISILGMFIMVRSNDLIVFYLGWNYNLSLYILASIDRDNLKSSEAGIKYFVLKRSFLWPFIVWMFTYFMDLLVQQILI